MDISEIRKKAELYASGGKRPERDGGARRANPVLVQFMVALFAPFVFALAGYYVPLPYSAKAVILVALAAVMSARLAEKLGLGIREGNRFVFHLVAVPYWVYFIYKLAVSGVFNIRLPGIADLALVVISVVVGAAIIEFITLRAIKAKHSILFFAILGVAAATAGSGIPEPIALMAAVFSTIYFVVSSKFMARLFLLAPVMLAFSGVGSDGDGFFFVLKLFGMVIGGLIVYALAKSVIDYFLNGDKRPAAHPVVSAHDAENPLDTHNLAPEVPDTNFENLYGYDELKERLLKFAYDWRANRKRNGILLYGPPGTGKSAFARALAGELGLPLYHINISTIKSRWIGQSSQQLKDIFAKAQAQDSVLFIDEIDSVIRSREDSASMHKDEMDVVTTFLAQVDALRRQNRALLIGATNYLELADKAAVREGRFDLKEEVGLPDHAARKGLMLDVLNAANVKVDEEVIDRVAARWVGFNVPRLRGAAEHVVRKVGKGGKAGRGDFREALRELRGKGGGVPENVPSLSDLYLDAPVAERLRRLATLFAKADEVEELGGSVPRAVLFYGPPGTGKTTMAKVLAKESGYAFIATTGSELAKPGVIERIHKTAADMRPAIIFIDEAETAIGARGSVGSIEVTTELLARMDGVKSVPDVIWIAATNHAEVIDPAMASRFTEKIELPVPGREAIERMIADWAKKRADKIAGGVEAWVSGVVDRIGHLAPRDVSGILDAAYNAAVAEAVAGGGKVRMTVGHVEKVFER